MANLANSNAVIPVNEQDSNKIGTYNLALQILDGSINGVLSITAVGGTVTLTGTTGSLATAQAQNLFINIASTLTSNLIVEIPVAAGTGRNRIYVVRNATSGAFTVTVRKVGGTGVTVTQGHTVILLYNGSDIQYAGAQVNSSTGALAALSNIVSGTYTPTLTAVANVAATTAYLTQYMRVGNVVTVAGRLDVDPTSASTLTRVGISLPIASAFSDVNQNQAGGTAVASAGVQAGAGAIISDSTNDRAELQFNCLTITVNTAIFFTFTYLVV